MGDAKYTPGPWISRGPVDDGYGQHTNALRIYSGDKDSSRWVADVGCHMDDERIANANLIAAAPDLLWALERLARHDAEADVREGLPHCSELDHAADVIAKVKGVVGW